MKIKRALVIDLVEKNGEFYQTEIRMFDRHESGCVGVYIVGDSYTSIKKEFSGKIVKIDQDTDSITLEPIHLKIDHDKYINKNHDDMMKLSVLTTANHILPAQPQTLEEWLERYADMRVE